MSKRFKFTIGLPFSGKSTVAEEYRQNGWKIISRDDLLEKINASVEFANEVGELIKERGVASNGEVFDIKNEVAIKMLNEAVKKEVLGSDDENIFYDGTNLQRQVRQGLLELKNEGVAVSALYFKTPIEIILERARVAFCKQERAGRLNEGAFVNLEKMISMFQEPDDSEGIEQMEIIEPNQEVNRQFINK